MKNHPGTAEFEAGRRARRGTSLVGAIALGGCVGRTLPIHDTSSDGESGTSGPTGDPTGPGNTDPGTSGGSTNPSTTSTPEPRPPPDLGDPTDTGDLCEPWPYPPTATTSHGPICPPDGVTGPDTGIPVIEILYPNSGHTFPAGAQFPFIFKFEDDLCVRAVDVTVDGQPLGEIELSPDESVLLVSGIQPGEYVFGFAAIDQSGNRSDQHWSEVFVCDG